MCRAVARVRVRRRCPERPPHRSTAAPPRDAHKLHDLLKRYTPTLIDQIAQGAACNRRHTIEQRCARWLLLSHDRAASDQFPLTQEFLVYILGVHRPAVVTALGALRRAGMAASTRGGGGGITVLDRPGLETAACECYGAIRARFDAVFA